MNVRAVWLFGVVGLALGAGCARETPGAASMSVIPTLRSAASPAGAGAPRRALFPPTPSGVHLNLVFNYGVKNVDSEIGVVDLVWGADAPRPRHVFNFNYTTFQREDVYGSNHSERWWKLHHPDWIEYKCDRKTISYGFGEPNMPFDIANPAVWAYQRLTAVDPPLKAGYQGVAFDNVDLTNDDGRCGHYASDGAWVQQYSGNYGDARYSRDVLAWARSTYAYVHAFSSKATMAMNFSYQFASSFAENYALATQTDLDLAESGFTNWGGPPNVTTPQEWSAIVKLVQALQAHGTCFMENGEEPGLSKDISQAERLWVVGNYLLTRDSCTYMWISGFTASNQQDYGVLLLYPEYKLPIGAPSGEMTAEAGAWTRTYSGGIAIVNPSERAVTVPLHGAYEDENGTSYSGSIRLPATSAQILLK
ncbi:MAG: hypothetical protein JO199_08990 [Candidatus Eremiobacteraeota bacterium]|nr:hypothetical protein [Candidatus Eremiobacteraeota bacterium]